MVFFKALLFLCAGGLSTLCMGRQNIHRMGGLKKHLPWTHICFMAGFLALMGIPPLAGFFSKDEILWSVFASGHGGLWAVAFCTAGLTAFYMTRLCVLVFYGKAEFHQILNLKRGAFQPSSPWGYWLCFPYWGDFWGFPMLLVCGSGPSSPSHRKLFKAGGGTYSF